MSKAGSESPDTLCDPQATFGCQLPWSVPAFAQASDHVPVVDPAFQFDPNVCRAILLGFAHGRRVYLYGPHGSGKSTHIEQVAARLNWPCLRINLDGHVSRADLIGRDMLVVRDGKQVTEFVPGLLVWALQRPMALVLDEYDAGRPEVMFVIQRLLEADGRLTLLDQNQVITPHPAFRLFATGNTAGSGDSAGLYAGTQVLNQAQLDRWNVMLELGYPGKEQEARIIHARLPTLTQEQVRGMLEMAWLCRQAHEQGELSSLLSLRTLLAWGENLVLLEDMAQAFSLSFLNRCDVAERPLVAELYQRCFARELPDAGR
ncbi:AAA family ATPase [Aquipseudomonas alcaligenes]|uniref:Cobaltochelatase CobS subunit n=1 Tax=Aquipseudomonas alcaligenes TaxID=43263 RepID=A0A1N6UY82_AQUAC|nr:AAA family ATPase [Pseudomonas alcaligenes]SIQ70472.1 cobaltochelatase CobS subunit [Pseudomonas alcaligenes]